MNYKINNKGSILIYLLILISILFFLVFHEIFYSKLNYKLAVNYINKQQNYEDIKYVTYVVGEIIKNKNLYDEFFEDGFLNYYKNENLLKINKEEYYIKIEKEENKININNTKDEVIKNEILKNFKDEFDYDYLDSIADKILDWKDKDDYVRLHGAEKEDYKDKGYYPKNDNLISIFELLYIKDMRNDLFFKYDKKSHNYSGLLTLFTIYGNNTFRLYIKKKNKIYIVFFKIGNKKIKIIEWRLIKS